MSPVTIHFLDGPLAGHTEETDETRLILTVEGLKERPRLMIERWDMGTDIESVRVLEYRLVVPSSDGVSWEYKVVD